MKTTAMTVPLMPNGGINDSLCHDLTLRKQASKPLFLNKGLLLSDRSLTGRRSQAISCGLNKAVLCLETVIATSSF